MPYRIRKQENKFCVFNSETGENKGCSDSRSTALGHMRALYAAEGGAKMGKKELEDLLVKSIKDSDEPEDLLKCYGETMAYAYVPWGITSFAALDAWKEMQETTFAIQQDAQTFTNLVSNIMADEEVDDKVSAVKALADEYSERVQLELEEEEMDEEEEDEKAVWSAASVNDLPDSAFLYIEPGGKKDEGGKTTPRSLRHLPYKDSSGKIDLPHLRNAIARIPQMKGVSSAKKASLQAKARKLLGNANKEDQSFLSNLVDKVKDLLGHPQEETVEKATADDNLMIYKDGDHYRWIARYSNNFRDNDTRPEIISDHSHRRFVEMVDKGLIDKPEFWIWHVPEWNIGKSEWVAYDDTGFAMAGGSFAKGLDAFAEHLSTLKDIKLSHGMPVKSIKRDPNDDSVIIEHITREISILPGWSAANPLTGFVVLKESNQEEARMAIPKDKREKLLSEWKLSEEQLNAIEQLNVIDSDKANAEGIESKENGTAPAVTEPAAEAPPAPVVESTPPTTPTADELRAVLSAVVVESIKPLADRLDALEGELKTLKESDGQKIADLVKNSTTASLSSLLGQSIQSVIGLKETEIDGRTQLAKDKPVEAKTPVEGRTLVPFINELLSQPKSQ